MAAFSPFTPYSREEWARLRADTPLTLTEEELQALRGQNENVALSEVEDIYLPLARLLNLYVNASQELFRASQSFLGCSQEKVPYIIGLAGSVAVGKSTTSRILQALLARLPHHPKVGLVTTDGFLYPNRVLDEKGIMARKGFPESYDLPEMVRFVSDLKAGRQNIEIPVYSHRIYDIVPDEHIKVDQPDIMLVEGLNVLQTTAHLTEGQPQVFVSDYFDFTIYVDGETRCIEQWYVDRFKTFCTLARSDSGSFFHRFRDWTEEQAEENAREIWRKVNLVNLEENILPTRERASLILSKGPDHSVENVSLRKL